MIAAAIDIGTNSVKLCVSTLDEGELKIIEDAVVITRLGESLAQTGSISSESAERTASEVVSMCMRAKELGADAIRIIGTECVRRAENTPDLAATITARTGVPLEVISSEMEAEMSFAGCMSTIKERGRITYIDIGGGSSEIVIGGAEGIESAVSARVGALVLSRMFFSDGDGSRIRRAIGYVKEIASPLLADDFGIGGRYVYVSGGSAVVIASVQCAHMGDGSQLDGLMITRSELARQIGIYSSTSCDGIKKVPGMDPGRADTILGGACVLDGLLEVVGAEGARLCRRGLRHGAVLMMLRG